MTDSSAPAPSVLRGRRGGSAAPPRRRLPWRLRIARGAELACLPVLGVMLLSLPLPRHVGEMVATLIIAVECVATVVVAVGLPRRRRSAAVIALLLAAWLIVNGVLRLPVLIPALGAFGRFAFLAALLMDAWVLLMQLMVVMALASSRVWRDELPRPLPAGA